MSRPWYGRTRAVFPPGYTAGHPAIGLLYRLGVRSPALRSFVLSLPRSRVRTFLVANYMHRHAAAWNSDKMDRVLESYAPEIEFEMFGGLGTFQGREGVREATTAWREAAPNLRLILEEWTEVDGNRFVTIVLGRGEGAASGIAFGQRIGMVWTLRGPWAVRCVWYPTAQEALEAVGLLE